MDATIDKQDLTENKKGFIEFLIDLIRIISKSVKSLAKGSTYYKG